MPLVGGVGGVFGNTLAILRSCLLDEPIRPLVEGEIPEEDAIFDGAIMQFGDFACCFDLGNKRESHLRFVVIGGHSENAERKHNPIVQACIQQLEGIY